MERMTEREAFKQLFQTIIEQNTYYETFLKWMSEHESKETEDEVCYAITDAYLDDYIGSISYGNSCNPYDILDKIKEYLEDESNPRDEQIQMLIQKAMNKYFQ